MDRGKTVYPPPPSGSGGIKTVYPPPPLGSGGIITFNYRYIHNSDQFNMV
jgi:hypothetical protein